MILTKDDLIKYAELEDLLFQKALEYSNISAVDIDNLLKFDIKNKKVYIKYIDYSINLSYYIELSFDEFIKFCNGNK